MYLPASVPANGQLETPFFI